MQVHSLHIYPVKSARATAAEYATVKPTGFEHDRQFFVGSPETGEVITQRENPLMATLSVTMGPGDFDFRREKIKFELRGRMSEARVAQDSPKGSYKFIRSEVFTGYDCGDGVADFISRKLGQSVRLLWCGDITRSVDPRFADNAETVYADGFPFLVTTLASLAALNAGMRELGLMELGMERFRPNLVIEGDFPAFDEDNWKRIRIGKNIVLELPKPCGRCPIPATDQETGERPDATVHMTGLRHLGRLGTIKATEKPGMFFGMNARAVEGFGQVAYPKLEVKVLERHPEPLWSPLKPKA